LHPLLLALGFSCFPDAPFPLPSTTIRPRHKRTSRSSITRCLSVSSAAPITNFMEFDANGRPLRRRLLAGFLEALPLVEDDADTAYLPLGDDSQVLLAQARASYTDHIANHDAGDASVGATAGATNNDGYADDGRDDAASAALAPAAVPSDDDSWSADDGRRAEPAPATSAPARGTPRRRPRRHTPSAASANRNPTQRPPKRGERPYTMEELVSAFLLELRVATNLDTRMPTDEDFEGGCVHGAQVLVFVEMFDPIATWTALVNGKIVVLCSCGGTMGTGSSSAAAGKLEHVEVQWARKKNSSCRHATALLAAYGELTTDFGVPTPETLLRAVPLLAGPNDSSDGKPGDTVVHLVSKVGKRLNIPLFAVSYMMVWAPAIVRPGGNRSKLATCCLLSCQTQPWGCPHAKAVNRHNRIEATAASEAAAEAQLALRFGVDGVLNEMGNQPEDGPVAVAPAVPAAPAAPPSPRRARNMFPCSREVAQCDVYGKFVDTQRAAGDVYRYDNRLHVEELCILCRTPRGDSLPSTIISVLFTTRGRMQILVGEWACPNGHVVKYDGSADGLFAATPQIIYTRVFLDLVLELCVIARSTMASACQYLTSLLRNTAAYGDGEPGQARQLLSHAVGEFSDTLVVPTAAFKCHHCGYEEASGGPFRCIVCDGQMLSVLQAHIKEMLRPGGNAPRVDFAILFACAVRSSSVRALVRRRVRKKPGEEVELTATEARAWPSFASAATEPPPPAPPLPTGDGPVVERTPLHNEQALRWSTSTVFNHFFGVQGRAAPAQPAPGAVPAGGPLPPPPDVADDDAAASPDEYDDVDIGSGNNSTGSSENETAVADSTVGSGSSSGYASDAVGDVGQINDSDSEPVARTGAADASLPVSSSSSDAGEAHGGCPRPSSSCESAPRPETFASSPPSSAPPPPRRRSRGAAAAPAPRSTRRSSRRRTFSGVEGVEVGESDPWMLNDGEVEQVPAGEQPSDDPVAVNRADPLSPLTQRAIKATAHAINPAAEDEDKVLVNIDDIPLRFGDFKRTKPFEWLNDEIMNAFVKLLIRGQRAAELASASAPHSVFFNTFFYEKLVQNNAFCYEAVVRWTRNENVLEAAKLFIPVNISNVHWLLAVVVPSLGRIELYDSNGAAPMVVGDHLARWAKRQASERRMPKTKWVTVPMACRQQENSDDCGVFTLRHMQLLMKGEDVVSWEGRLWYHRRRLAAELLSASL